LTLWPILGIVDSENVHQKLKIIEDEKRKEQLEKLEINELKSLACLSDQDNSLTICRKKNLIKTIIEIEGATGAISNINKAVSTTSSKKRMKKSSLKKVVPLLKKVKLHNVVFDENKRREELKDLGYDELCKLARVSVVMAEEAKADNSLLISLIIERERETCKKSFTEIRKSKKRKSVPQKLSKSDAVVLFDLGSSNVRRYSKSHQFRILTQEEKEHIAHIDNNNDVVK